MTRGGILASGTAAVLFMVAAFAVAGRSGAQAQVKNEAALETKGDASARPWKRYSGWPARDEAKYNTLQTFSKAPKPTRNYDAISLTVNKRFSKNWLLRASYTYSRLVGNYQVVNNIAVDNAAVGYDPATPVLGRVTLRIDNDDRIALLGSNGNGKSTLVKLIASRLEPMQGRASRTGWRAREGP